MPKDKNILLDLKPKKSSSNSCDINEEVTSNSLEAETIQSERRRTLVGLTLGSGALFAWHKPVIETVILPAHAQTSNDITMDDEVIEEEDVVEEEDMVEEDMAEEDMQDDIETDMEDNAPQNFFATNAAAQEVSNVGKIIIDFIVPTAVARVATNEEPLQDLVFQAQAVDMGNGTYSLTIAAEKLPENGRVSPTTSRNFIFGWQGDISNLNSPGSLVGTGCAQNETGQVTALSASSLTIELTYFSKTIELLLDAGAADIPAFPLSCS